MAIQMIQIAFTTLNPNHTIKARLICYKMINIKIKFKDMIKKHILVKFAINSLTPGLQTSSKSLLR